MTVIIERDHVVDLTPNVRKALGLRKMETPDPRSFVIIPVGYYKDGRHKLKLGFTAREFGA